MSFVIRSYTNLYFCIALSVSVDKENYTVLRDVIVTQRAKWLYAMLTVKK